MILKEDKRNELVNKSKRSDSYKDKSKGKNRYQRRLHSHFGNSVKQFNQINMNKLFKDDILDVDVSVIGETDHYLVKMSFRGVIKNLSDELKSKSTEGQDFEINYASVQKALIKAFNSDDVYVHCSCPDWQYRFADWSIINNTNSDTDGDNAKLNSAPHRDARETNPNDTKGSACKHVLLLLNNNAWLSKVASVITNYIKYMKVHKEKIYAKIIYPALYGKQYTAQVQQDIDDKDELETDTDTIDKSNTYARTKTQFKKGNQSGIQFAPNDTNKQLNMDNVMGDEESQIDN